GLVVTDWGAVNDRPQGVAAGLDLEMPGSGGLNDCAAADAVRAGVLEEADLNTAARNVTALILASENNSAAPEVDFDAHHALARRAAREGAVLLKNNDATLPFKKSGKLAVIGAFAEAPRFQGAGSSQVNATQIDKPLDMFAAALDGAGEVVYAKGFDPETAETDEKLIAEAVACAEAADQVIVMVGLPPLFEAEGFDRGHLRQPTQLDALVAAVAKANPACAVVLSNGAPIEMPWIDTVPAVLEIYLAGQAGAGALCDLVFGEVSPSGKLAETFPLALNDCPAQENFATHPRQIIYREGLNVGYRHFVTHEAPVLFPFGHGLSYTTFDYTNLRVSGDTSAHGLNLEVRVDITNSGPCAGAEIVQLYVRDVEASVYRPDRELKAFRKLYLDAGETATCTLVLDRRSFAFFDIGADDWVIEPGAFELLVGASCTDIRQSINIDLNGDTRRNTPKTQETPYVTMTDNELAARGLHVMVAESVKPYHANTTLADIQHHWLGKRIVAMVFKAIEGTLGPTKTDSPVMIKMRNEMVLSMRLNTVRIMSGGALSEKRFRLLLDLLNNRWAHFFVELFRR
ncbi:MAG: glycoside hydrolase family 3 C-terminal domain-containing protein, partial [Pseudomonadota bacterium]|nr:glycoside hydrolase family 3 C-terminal domain-containing protein [Pseudomonadota bacterium]